MSYWIKRAHVPKDAICRSCKKPLGKLDDIGEYRNLWPGPTTDFLCMECHMKRRARPEAT